MRALWFRAALASLGFWPFAAPALAQGGGTDLVEFLYGTGYDGRVHDEQGVITYRHTAPWTVGDNFFFVDFSDVGNFGQSGSTYVEWGPRLSPGRLFGSGPTQLGLIRDVYVVGELNHTRTKTLTNTVPLYGLSVDLGLPGFRVFKLHLEHRDDSRYDGSTGQMSIIWNYPFSLAGQSFTVEGFLDVVGTEGASEGSVHTQPQLVWKASDRVNLGVEYQYWRNKQGRAGFTESVMQGMVRVNF